MKQLAALCTVGDTPDFTLVNEPPFNVRDIETLPPPQEGWFSYRLMLGDIGELNLSRLEVLAAELDAHNVVSTALGIVPTDSAHLTPGHPCLTVVLRASGGVRFAILAG